MRPPQFGPYEFGYLKGPPALRRSEKEGGRRPPESFRILKAALCVCGWVGLSVYNTTTTTTTTTNTTV